jgi:hypothetical protein
MVSFGKPVAELSFAQQSRVVRMRFSLPSNKYLASFSPGEEGALNGSSF